MENYHWLFTKKTEKDFSRKKKWSFSEILKFMLTLEGKSLKNEILKFFEYNDSTPTNSAFNQRRAPNVKL